MSEAAGRQIEGLQQGYREAYDALAPHLKAVVGELDRLSVAYAHGMERDVEPPDRDVLVGAVAALESTPAPAAPRTAEPRQ